MEPFKTEKWEDVHASRLLVLMLTSHFDALLRRCCFCFEGKCAALSLGSFAAALHEEEPLLLRQSADSRMRQLLLGGEMIDR